MSDSRYNRAQPYRSDYNRDRRERNYRDDERDHRRSGERSRSPDRYHDRYSPDGRGNRYEYRRDDYPYRGRGNDHSPRNWGNKAYPDERRSGKWRGSRIERSGEERSQERNLGEPNNHVILQGLPFLATEHQIQQTLESLQASIENIRLIRDHKTGASRRYAFVKFTSVEHARQFIEANYPYIMVDKVRVNIAYSHSASVEDEGWACKSCRHLNYKWLDRCHQCQNSKKESMSSGSLHSATSSAFLNFNDGSKDGSPYPHNILLVRGLDPLTTEESLHSAVSSYGPAEMLKRVLLIKDRASRLSWGFAFLEYLDIPTSAKVLSIFNDPQTFPRGFTIDSRAVTVSYANPGCFIPVYATTEWKIWGDEGVALSYWDENAYAVEYKGPNQQDEEKQQVSTVEDVVHVPEKVEMTIQHPAPEASIPSDENNRSVEDELNAFYSDMGAVLTSSGKSESKSIFSVSDMVSTTSQPSISDELAKNADTELKEASFNSGASEKTGVVSEQTTMDQALSISSGSFVQESEPQHEPMPKNLGQIAIMKEVSSQTELKESVPQYSTIHDSCVAIEISEKKL